MNALQVVIKSINVKTLWLGVASVAAGCAAATAHGYVDTATTILCLVFALVAQCSGNIAHRYYDELHGYGENIRDGISNEDDDGRPMIYVLKEGMRVFFIMQVTIGLAILMVVGWWTLIPGIILFTIDWLNNHGKHPWSQSLLYPIITFLIFGPLAVLTTQMAIGSAALREWDWWDIKPGIVMSIVIGIMAMNSHIIYRAAHAKMGLGIYTSFTGRYGIKVTAGILAITTLLYSAILGAAPMEMQFYTGLGFLLLPTASMLLSFGCIYILLKNNNPPLAWRLSIMNILMVSISCLLIFWFMGYPNMSEIPTDQILILI